MGVVLGSMRNEVYASRGQSFFSVNGVRGTTK